MGRKTRSKTWLATTRKLPSSSERQVYTAECSCSATVFVFVGRWVMGVDGSMSRVNRMRVDPIRPIASLYARTDVLVGLGLAELVGEGLEAVHIEHALAPVPVEMNALER